MLSQAIRRIHSNLFSASQILRKREGARSHITLVNKSIDESIKNMFECKNYAEFEDVSYFWALSGCFHSTALHESDWRAVVQCVVPRIMTDVADDVTTLNT